MFLMWGMSGSPPPGVLVPMDWHMISLEEGPVVQQNSDTNQICRITNRLATDPVWCLGLIGCLHFSHLGGDLYLSTISSIDR